MTTDPNYDLDGTEMDDESEAPDPEKFREMRRKANKADGLAKENERLKQNERELAYFRAGLTADELGTPIGQLFAKSYDGELTTEAVTAAWSALGNTTPAPEPATEISPEEQQSTRERQALASGAHGDTGATPAKPVRGRDGTAAQAGRDALANGASREDALGEVFSNLAGAAAAGDDSVILPFGGGTRQQ